MLKKLPSKTRFNHRFRSKIKNIKNIKIAATVPFNYQKHKYLEQQEELGKLLGKEDEVKNGKNSGKKNS